METQRNVKVKSDTSEDESFNFLASLINGNFARPPESVLHQNAF